MAVELTKQTLSIDGIHSISISDIEAGATSGYVRKVDFYTDELTVTNRTPILTVWLYGEEEVDLKVATPILSF